VGVKGMRASLALKRGLDVLFSLFLLLLFSPLFLLFSLWIRGEDGGGVFFRQQRLGKDCRVFEIVKFRSMVPNAEHKGAGIHVGQGDERITRVGRFLRKTSLDELPQLWNILKGDMSFIGPRPPLTFFPYRCTEYPESVKVRFGMRPGMTGLAQVNGRNEIPWEERFPFDVAYVEKWSLALDWKIFWKTLILVVRRKGIYG